MQGFTAVVAYTATMLPWELPRGSDHGDPAHPTAHLLCANAYAHYPIGCQGACEISLIPFTSITHRTQGSWGGHRPRGLSKNAMELELDPSCVIPTGVEGMLGL